jgi:hypothetical protein
MTAFQNAVLITSEEAGFGLKKLILADVKFNEGPRLCRERLLIRNHTARQFPRYVL